MYTLKLPDGRELLLERIEICGTYDGHLEGSYATVTEYVLKRLAARSREEALQVIAQASPLPRYRCDARFSSAAFDPADNDLRTSLTLVWFVDRVAVTFSELFREVVTAIKWKKFAKEYDPCDF